MKIRFKKLMPNAVIPTKAHPTDVGFDLTLSRFDYDELGVGGYKSTGN